MLENTLSSKEIKKQLITHIKTACLDLPAEIRSAENNSFHVVVKSPHGPRFFEVMVKERY